MQNESGGVEISRHADRVVVRIQHTHLRWHLQWTQWRELIIAGPVNNCVGSRGNSFPGIYYFEPARKLQWVAMAEGPVDWRECMLDARLKDDVLELGLFSKGALDPQVSLKACCSEIESVPNQWTALETLIAKSFELLPLPTRMDAAPAWVDIATIRPDYTPDWMEMASECLAGLRSAGQHPLGRQLGGVAFHSMLSFHESRYATPRPDIELIPQVSIARSLHRLMQSTPVVDITDIARKVVERVVPRFYNAELGLFENNYFGKVSTSPKRSRRGWLQRIRGSPLRESVVLETWYALSNLGDILYLCEAFPNTRLKTLALKSVLTWIEIAKEIGHIWPLFLNATNREGEGSNLNIAAGGLYANVMLSAGRIWPDRADTLMTEAAQALIVMRRFPVQQLFHQPEQLARAAECAFVLGTEDRSYEKMGHDFIHALLLMMYREPVNAGLFEGCASMMYPTFRETVASLTALATLRDHLPGLPIRTICELGLSKCFRFVAHPSPGQVLPREGLATKEISDAQNIGMAVYAAGGVFDVAYLQRRLM